MASVDISNVTKSFGAQQILHGINLSVKDGEFVALVGPSGCGKSTLLRLIAGLEEIGGGQIAIDGAVVNNLAPKDRDIAMVFQNYALYPHMTVRDNMAFSLKLRKMSEAEIERQVAAAADILGMTPYLRHFPRQLSGGQRQRVAMGRAIVRDPKVFLFDEPLSNLDARLRVDMRTEIKTLHQRLGSTSIYVTHDQVEAMTMADRIIVLTDGKVEQIGSPLELYDNPANLTVAGFIGSPAMNFIPGVLRKNEDGVAVTLHGGVSLSLSEHTGGTDGQNVIFGVRPEHLQLNSSRGLPCSVSVVEPTGASTYVYANTAGTTICGMFAERHALTPSETIWLQALPDRVHLFDAATRQAIPMERRKAEEAESSIQATLTAQYSDCTAA